MYRSPGAVATGRSPNAGPVPVFATATEAVSGAALVREPGLLGDLGGEVVLLLLEALAELEPHEPADLDVLADLGDQLLLDLVVRLVRVLDPRLIEQADLLE